MKMGRALLTISIIAGLLCGCEATTRYNVLSFFFDGVPNPEKERAELQTGAKKGAAKAMKRFLHSPYAARMCNGCHLPPTNVLAAPIEELCYRCHKFTMDKKFIHGPLVSGGCRVCHDPHESAYPFLLVSDSEHFCLRCHDANAVAANKAHEGVTATCTSCHDAHMSDKEYLLK